MAQAPSARQHPNRPPRVGPVGFVRGVRARGFLDLVGDLWHEHGDVFEARLGTSGLVFAIHPDAVEHVNLTGRANYEKGRSYDAVRRYMLGDGLVASNGDLWKRQRKLMAPFFTPRGIQAYSQLMLHDALEFADRWEALAASGEEVDVANEMTILTASIILRSMFTAESPESVDRMKADLETMLAFTSDMAAVVRLPTWVPTARNRAYLEARDRVRTTMTDIIARRRATGEEDWPDDLLSRMMNARDPDTGEPMVEQLLRDESVTIFAAGHETTARTLGFAWYALARNAEVAGRLHDELDRLLGGRTPTLDDLRALPYTLRVIKEVLRLYPAAPVYARDAIGDDRIGDFAVPRGATVMVSPYYTHRHPEFWPDPERFDPDRWTPEAEAARHPHAYHPFAAGPRICIGNNFSLLESHLILAVLAGRFVPRLRPGFEPKVVMQGTLTADGGIPAVIERREPARQP